MLILHDPNTLKHETIELLGARLIPALESPGRIRTIVQSILEDATHTLQLVELQEKDVNRLQGLLRSTHDAGYVRHLRDCHTTWVDAGHIGEDESILPECFPTFSMPHHAKLQKSIALSEPADIFARSGFYAFDMSTGIMKDTYTAVLASANLAVEASYRLANDSSVDTIFALCRPPGHHCDTQRAGGYCYLNNTVLAATALLSTIADSAARDIDLEVAVLDIDMHHGNGTQSFFYNRKVRYVSIHGRDEYPYFSGQEDEIGLESGFGYNTNFPLAQKMSEEDYLASLDEALDVCLQDQPSYVVLSLGFDTFHLDPLGGFDLNTSSYVNIGRLIEQKLRCAHTRCVIILEGGYVIDRLGENLLAFVKGWEDGRV